MANYRLKELSTIGEARDFELVDPDGEAARSTALFSTSRGLSSARVKVLTPTIPASVSGEKFGDEVAWRIERSDRAMEFFEFGDVITVRAGGGIHTLVVKDGKVTSNFAPDFLYN